MNNEELKNWPKAGTSSILGLYTVSMAYSLNTEGCPNKIVNVLLNSANIIKKFDRLK